MLEMMRITRRVLIRTEKFDEQLGFDCARRFASLCGVDVVGAARQGVSHQGKVFTLWNEANKFRSARLARARARNPLNRGRTTQMGMEMCAVHIPQL